ncbi:MAG: peptide chain release factor N(5)-glutamine methyltransferase [Pirellulales bacterium]|nr:peptide chain release factor N(5)-glutamine methyltransferase [Pirellulales bacterium]
MSTAPWTVGRLLQWTADFLKKHGSESALLDSQLLLAEAMGCKKIELYTRFEEEPAETVRTTFRALVKRRSEGAPVAYLVGHREFYSLDFRVTPDVLIPRPETELLVVTLLDLAKSKPKDAPWSIADVGTGSGILAVCAAKNLPGARVTALEISPAALEVARENAEKHGVGPRIDFLESDLFSAMPPAKKFDFILGNPPYVSSGEMEKLPPDVKNFEPRTALIAGPHGTEIIERLIPQAHERLNPGGYLLIEISPMIEVQVRQLIEAQGGFELLPTVKDLARLPRVVQARKE